MGKVKAFMRMDAGAGPSAKKPKEDAPQDREAKEEQEEEQEDPMDEGELRPPMQDDEVPEVSAPCNPPSITSMMSYKQCKQLLCALLDRNARAAMKVLAWEGGCDWLPIAEHIDLYFIARDLPSPQDAAEQLKYLVRCVPELRRELRAHKRLTTANHTVSGAASMRASKRLAEHEEKLEDAMTRLASLADAIAAADDKVRKLADDFSAAEASNLPARAGIQALTGHVGTAAAAQQLQLNQLSTTLRTLQQQLASMAQQQATTQQLNTSLESLSQLVQAMQHQQQAGGELWGEDMGDNEEEAQEAPEPVPAPAPAAAHAPSAPMPAPAPTPAPVAAPTFAAVAAPTHPAGYDHAMVSGWNVGARQMIPKLLDPTKSSGNKDAGDVEEAIFRFEGYLAGCKIPKEDWPTHAAHMLTDKALTAWTAVAMPAKRANLPITWEIFVDTLLKSFAHPDRHLKARAQLHKVSMQNNQAATEYVRFFNSLVVRGGEPKSAEVDLIQFFFNGLTERLRSACPIDPTTGRRWSSLSAFQDHVIIIYTSTAKPAELVARVNTGVRGPITRVRQFKGGRISIPSLHATQANQAGPSTGAGRGTRTFGRGRGGRGDGANGGCGQQLFTAHAPISTGHDGKPIWPPGSVQANEAKIKATEAVSYTHLRAHET